MHNISRTSKAAVADQLRRIKQMNVLSAGRFISSSNTFRVVPRSAQRNDAEIAEYIAASCITHLYDGWNYMSAALRAFIHNDVGVCGHSAYYAELRAALTFLAVNGIVICKNEGYYIRSDSTIDILYRGETTHKAVWHALQEFANMSSSTTDKVLVEDIITVEKLKISDWIRELSGTQASRTLCNSLLLECGADIQRYGDDHIGRNKYSYSPTGLEQYRMLTEEDIRCMLSKFWELFEPVSPGQFEKLDLYILQSIYGRFRDAMNLDAAVYEAKVRMVIKSLISNSAQELVFSKLCTQRYGLPFDLSEDGVANGDLYGGMLVRACFMLRLATAACRDLLLRAGVTSNDLDRWLIQCQQNRFMWQAAVSHYAYVDLWADVDESITSLMTYAPNATDSWLLTESRSLETLSKTEYIMLWGLGL